MTPVAETEPLWRVDEDRWVDRRSQVLRRRDGLDAPVAEAIAWHELGCSSSGVAKQIGSTQATVRDYFDRVEADHGLAAVVIKRADERGVEAPLRAPSVSVTGGDGQ